MDECRFVRNTRGFGYLCETHIGASAILCTHAAQELERQVKEAEYCLQIRTEIGDQHIHTLESHLAMVKAWDEIDRLKSRLAQANDEIVLLREQVLDSPAFTYLLDKALKDRLSQAERRCEELLRDPTTAEIARLRSIVQERDIEQAKLQRELNLRVEMLLAAVEWANEADAMVARMREARDDVVTTIKRNREQGVYTDDDWLITTLTSDTGRKKKEGHKE